MSNENDQATGLIFNIQKFSIQDGPGIRTTVFMKGCPLNCPWCSNPEGICNTPQIMVLDRKCISCKKCASICPTQAIRFENTTRIIDWERCIQCLECGENCPSRSIEVAGVYKTVDEVFKIVVQDEMYYRTSGGGVTVSGGEALRQWEFVLELFKKCKKAGYHTTLDTTGFCKWKNMEKVLQYTDLILFDLKHMDSERHKEITGISNDVIIENLKQAAKIAKIWLRIPLTSGFNDSESNMMATGELAKSIQAEKISLLPHHDWGKEKYARLGKTYTFNEVEALTADSPIVLSCKKILESFGLKIEVGA